MKPAPERFDLPITVQPEDIDLLGHVNNVVYLRWVQDVAIAHWEATAPAEARRRLFWVVTRHEIEYRRPAFLGDELVARTWVGEASGRDFARHTEILRSGDGKLLAAARTVWCPMSRETGRPADVDDDVRRRFSVSTSG